MKRGFVLCVLCLCLVAGITACSKEKGVTADNSCGYLYPAYREEDGIRKWGLINAKGEFVVQPVYDGMDWQSGGRWVNIFMEQLGQEKGVDNTADVEQIWKVGLLDRTNGKVLLAPENLYIADFAEGLAAVLATDDKSLVIDEQGQVIFETGHRLIDNYSQGVVKFKKKGESLYGYLDQQGKVVIDPVYQEAGDFTDGKALVTIAEGEQALIDLNGKVLKKYSFAQADGLTEGLIKYVDQATQKWGFASLEGDELIAPAFTYADNFCDGTAIVQVDYLSYGVIDQEGKFVIKPIYGSIHYLGDGKYGVCRGDGHEYYYMHKAIFDCQGKQITDFLYYDLGQFQNGNVSVCDGEETYFLDQSGKVVEDLPRIAELGRLEIDGDLIKAEIGKHIHYYTKDGTLLWAPKVAYQLGDIQIKEEMYQPCWSICGYYPQIEGLQNVVLQSALNRGIKEAVKKNTYPEGPDEDGYFQPESHENFTLKRHGDLLVIKYEDPYYRMENTNESGRIRCDHFNVREGTGFLLKDLFQAESPYLESLAAQIKWQISEQIEAGEDMFGPDPEPFKGFTKDPYYELTPENLILYLPRTEVGGYASELIMKFVIPYRELADIINTEGVLWQSLP